MLGTDLDRPTLDCARANLDRAGRPDSLVLADAEHGPWRSGAVRAVLIDPDRRPQGQREGDPEAWSPRLSRCLALASEFEGGCIKLPPGHDPQDLPQDGRLQWTSLGGELRELCLWTGVLAEDRPSREALVLRRDGGRATLSGELEQVPPLDPAQAARVAWLAEPDPAVIRSGLIGRLAASLDLRPLGPGLAYLGGDRRPESPLLRSWRVLGTSSLDRKRVRALLAEHGVGPLTVKKRGHPDSAQVLAKRLAGRGQAHGLLAVARLARGHLALLLEPPGAGDPG